MVNTMQSADMGDFVIMKGGKSNALKPCVYRPPYAQYKQNAEHLVITVDACR